MLRYTGPILMQHWCVESVYCVKRPWHDKLKLANSSWRVWKTQQQLANMLKVGKYEFTNTKKLVKKLARIETSSICRQQFANMLANCLSCEGHLTRRGRFLMQYFVAETCGKVLRGESNSCNMMPQQIVKLKIAPRIVLRVAIFNATMLR